MKNPCWRWMCRSVATMGLAIVPALSVEGGEAPPWPTPKPVWTPSASETVGSKRDDRGKKGSRLVGREDRVPLEAEREERTLAVEEPRSDIIAVVGERTLTKAELDEKVNRLVKEKRKWLSLEKYEELRRGYEERIASGWLETVMLAEHARREGFEVTDEEVETSLQKWGEEQSQQGAGEDWHRVLVRIGIPEAELIEEIQDGILIEKMVRDRIRKDFSEESLRSIYKRNPAYFFKPQRRRLEQIFYPYEAGETSEHKSEMRKKMKKLRRRAKKGEPFGELIEELGSRAMETFSGRKGGDLGWISATVSDTGFGKTYSLPREILKKVFDLEEGKTSDVIESRYGLHILRVKEIEPSSGNTFEEARDSVENTVFSVVKDQTYEGVRSHYRSFINLGGLPYSVLERSGAAPSGTSRGAPAEAPEDVRIDSF